MALENLYPNIDDFAFIGVNVEDRESKKLEINSFGKALPSMTSENIGQAQNIRTNMTDIDIKNGDTWMRVRLVGNTHLSLSLPTYQYIHFEAPEWLVAWIGEQREKLPLFANYITDEYSQYCKDVATERKFHRAAMVGSGRVEHEDEL